MGGQVQAAKAKILQQGEDRFRVEQVQPDTLRPRQSTTKDCTRTGTANLHTFTTLRTAEACALKMQHAPQRSVAGYKFNIFYPDLIDKSKAPTYHIERSDTQDTATSSEMQPTSFPGARRKIGVTCTSEVMLRFSAGPPYEDVAFKIVNREWNLSHKLLGRITHVPALDRHGLTSSLLHSLRRFGFRVVFDRGVLQLYFNVKRWRYRR